MTWKRTWQTKKKLFFGRGKTKDAELNKLAKLQQYLTFEIIIESYSLQLKNNIFKKKTCKLGKNYQIFPIERSDWLCKRIKTIILY
jgi:hypothetical protein